MRSWLFCAGFTDSGQFLASQVVDHSNPREPCPCWRNSFLHWCGWWADGSLLLLKRLQIELQAASWRTYYAVIKVRPLAISCLDVVLWSLLLVYSLRFPIIRYRDGGPELIGVLLNAFVAVFLTTLLDVFYLDAAISSFFIFLKHCDFVLESDISTSMVMLQAMR